MKFKQGEIVVIDFSPIRGHEQDGRRPALIVSNDDYNSLSGLRLVCPITTKIKGYPMHLNLDERTKTTGCILCNQVKCIDINARNPQKKEECPQDILANVLSIIHACF